MVRKKEKCPEGKFWQSEKKSALKKVRRKLPKSEDGRRRSKTFSFKDRCLYIM
jgi:hypothetical protein